MPKPRVFVSRNMPSDTLELIAQSTDMEVWPDEGPPTPEQLKEKLAGVEGVLVNIMDRVDGPLLDGAPHLKVVSQVAVGLDNVDVAECSRRNILVGNTPGVLSKATADHGFAIMLAAARRVVETDKWVRGNNWTLAYHPLYWLGTDVNEATLGIIGLGQIGTEMARRAMGFDMKVIYYSRNRKLDLEAKYGVTYADLDTLLASSDFISLHVPLTPETRHFIGEPELRKMKSTAILISLARGPVVDTDALCLALQEHWIGGAALDVVDPEPIPQNHPLLALDNLTITPHIGSASIISRQRVCLMAARNLLAGIQGERLESCANPEVYVARGI
jgi:glyoxylate reductase